MRMLIIRINRYNRFDKKIYGTYKKWRGKKKRKTKNDAWLVCNMTAGGGGGVDK